MSRLKRDLYAPKLTRLLSQAVDEGLVRSIWAIDLLQSGGESVAKQRLSYPAEAVTTDPQSSYYVHKWYLESLVNELLVTSKLPVPTDGRYRTFNHESFNALATAVNYYHRLEEAHDGISLERTSIFDEMSRIGHKQFEWQIPALQPARFYRSLFLYSGDICSEHFRRTHGLSISDFTLVGFAVFANLRHQPALRRDTSFLGLGVTDEVRDFAFRRLVLGLDEARLLAKQIRPDTTHIGYRKSVLRQYPCVAFGNNGERIRSPLCDLVLRRVTDGLYYDVVGAGGEFRDELGERFEQYALKLIDAHLPEMGAVAGNAPYKFAKKPLKTPDILIGRDRIDLVVECKANRMTFEAKFSTNFLGEGKKTHDALAHGVFQIWRFFSHVRQGALVGQRLGSDALGVVLTMDPWLIMSRQYPDIIRTAHQKADAVGEDIRSEDRKSVAFCSIEDFENLLAISTAESIRATIRHAATDEMSGWHVAHVHKEVAPELRARRPFPFKDELNSVLPWWKSRASVEM